MQNNLLENESLTDVEVQSLATILVFAEDVIKNSYEHRNEFGLINGQTNSNCEETFWRNVASAAITGAIGLVRLVSL
ncbi:MAG: hypothetical protein AAGC64_11350 [Bacteroidota bacterium]